MDTPKQLILSCIEKENKSVKKREKRRNYIGSFVLEVIKHAKQTPNLFLQ